MLEELELIFYFDNPLIKRIKKIKIKESYFNCYVLFILKLMQLLFYRYEKLRNLKFKRILINLIHYFATRAIKCTKEPNAILLESVKEHKSRVKRDVVKHRNGYFRPVCNFVVSRPSPQCDTWLRATLLIFQTIRS